MLTFASGLAIVVGHNVWGDPASAVVSLHRVDDDNKRGRVTAGSGRWLDRAARRHALSVTFRRLHDHSGAGGSVNAVLIAIVAGECALSDQSNPNRQGLCALSRPALCCRCRANPE